MRTVVEAVLAVDILLAVVTWVAATRLHPRTATWLLTAVAVVTAATSVPAIAIMAADPVGSLLLAAKLGRWPTPLGTASPIPDQFEAIAGLALVGILISAVRALFRQVSAARSSARLRRTCTSDADLVVVDTDTPVAFALPGRRPRIVVSRSMLRGLDGEERRALLAHERAHLHFHHRGYQAIVDLASGLCPPLWPYRRRVALSIERWADESAADEVADRRLVARSLGRAGLLSAGPPGIHAASLAFGQTQVVHRMHALLASPPRENRWTLLAPVLLSVSALTLAAVASHDFERLLELAVRIHTHH